MKIRLHHSFTVLALLALSVLSFHLSPARAQGTAQGAAKSTAQGTAQGAPFLYRGHLDLGGHPASGTYDLAFSLFDTAQGGAAAAGPVTQTAVKVSNGLYYANLDFGPGPFTSTNYWLDINVRPAGSNTFTGLSARQRLTPSPYAHGPPRLKTAVFMPRPPEQALQHPVPAAGPVSAQAQPTASRLLAPVPKP